MVYFQGETDNIYNQGGRSTGPDVPCSSLLKYKKANRIMTNKVKICLLSVFLILVTAVRPAVAESLPDFVTLVLDWKDQYRQKE